MADRGRKAFPVSSVLCDERYVKHCQQLHKERLANMKPEIDTSMPYTMSINIGKTNPRKAQKKAERLHEIDHENQILLEKMKRIHSADSRTSFKPFYGRYSLKLKPGLYYDACSGFRSVDHINVAAIHPSGPRGKRSPYKAQSEFVNMLRENTKIMNAINTCKPEINFAKMEKDHMSNCAKVERISKYRGPESARYTPSNFVPSRPGTAGMGSTGRPSTAGPRLTGSQTRPFSAYTAVFSDWDDEGACDVKATELYNMSSPQGTRASRFHDRPSTAAPPMPYQSPLIDAYNRPSSSPPHPGYGFQHWEDGEGEENAWLKDADDKRDGGRGGGDGGGGDDGESYGAAERELLLAGGGDGEDDGDEYGYDDEWQDEEGAAGQAHGDDDGGDGEGEHGGDTGNRLQPGVDIWQATHGGDDEGDHYDDDDDEFTANPAGNNGEEARGGAASGRDHGDGGSDDGTDRYDVPTNSTGMTASTNPSIFEIQTLGKGGPPPQRDFQSVREGEEEGGEGEGEEEGEDEAGAGGREDGNESRRSGSRAQSRGGSSRVRAEEGEEGVVQLPEYEEAGSHDLGGFIKEDNTVLSRAHSNAFSEAASSNVEIPNWRPLSGRTMSNLNDHYQLQPPSSPLRAPSTPGQQAPPWSSRPGTPQQGGSPQGSHSGLNPHSQTSYSRSRPGTPSSPLRHSSNNASPRTSGPGAPLSPYLQTAPRQSLLGRASSARPENRPTSGHMSSAAGSRPGSRPGTASPGGGSRPGSRPGSSAGLRQLGGQSVGGMSRSGAGAESLSGSVAGSVRSGGGSPRSPGTPGSRSSRSFAVDPSSPYNPANQLRSSPYADKVSPEQVYKVVL